MESGSESDHIGRIGEGWFHLLADRAKLLVGEIKPDRVGKDRIIEFHLAARREGVPFDKRPPPLKCGIQIKTIKQSTERVTVALSVAERLAGDPLPAFIAVIRVDELDEVVEMRLIHILDQTLGRILKRLREEFVNGSTTLNDHTISFTLSEGVIVERTPIALKEALSALIGSDIEAYAARKAVLRKTLGFDPTKQFTIKATFDGLKIDEFMDGMLGIRRLPVQEVKVFEERFEIKVEDRTFPLSDLSGATLEVQTSNVIPGSLTISSITTQDSVSLDCAINGPAVMDVPDEHYRTRAKTHFFDFVFSMGKLDIHLREPVSADDRHPIQDWCQFLKAGKLLSSGECKLVLLAGGASITGTASGDGNLDQMNWFNRLPGLERFDFLAREAGIGNVTVSLMDIHDNWQDITIVHAYFTRPEQMGPLTFNTESPPSSEASIIPVAVVNVLKVGEFELAYGLRMEMLWANTAEKGNVSWRSQSMRPMWLQRVGDDAGLRAFMVKVSRASGYEFVMRSMDQ